MRKEEKGKEKGLVFENKCLVRGVDVIGPDTSWSGVKKQHFNGGNDSKYCERNKVA